MESLEKHQPVYTGPWEARVQTDEPISEGSIVPGGAMQIAFSSSPRNDLVGFGVAIETTTPLSESETEDLVRHVERENRAKSVFRGAGDNGAYTEDTRGIERFSDHTDHEQQSGGSHVDEPSTTVGPGVCLSNLQAYKKAAEAWKSN